MTVNQQTARTIALPDGQTLYLSGMGYNGEGEVPVAGNGGKISETERERLNLLAELAILANEGSLVQEDGGWKHRGDAMDVALAFEGGEPGATQMASSVLTGVAGHCAKPCGGSKYGLKSKGDMPGKEVTAKFTAYPVAAHHKQRIK